MQKLTPSINRHAKVLVVRFYTLLVIELLESFLKKRIVSVIFMAMLYWWSSFYTLCSLPMIEGCGSRAILLRVRSLTSLWCVPNA